MTDLDQHPSTHSPRRKNFSFRFPNLSHSTSHDKDSSQLNGNGSHTLNNHQGLNYAGKDRRNFSEEAKNVPDLQVSVILSLPGVALSRLTPCIRRCWFHVVIQVVARTSNSNSQTKPLSPCSLSN